MSPAIIPIFRATTVFMRRRRVSRRNLQRELNGIGDFFSSIIAGVLWTAFGTNAAFGYSAALSVTGALLVLRPRASGTKSAFLYFGTRRNTLADFSQQLP